MGRGAIGLCKTNAVTRQTVGIGGLAGMIRVHHIGALLVGWLGRAIGPMATIRVNGLLMTMIALLLLLLHHEFRNWRVARAASQ